MLLNQKIKEYKIVLASKSPRRQMLLREMGIDFVVEIPQEVEENYPSTLMPREIPLFLAELKANAFGNIDNKTILVTADTIVHINGQILGKPVDKKDAFDMISLLSGNVHEVFTGVCIRKSDKIQSFLVESSVFFRKLKDEEIHYYIDTYKPFDKAGAYGAQEWLGYVGIERIEGSYFNVMGLPVQKLYEELEKFL